jgi:hypothetical protein
MIQPAFNWTAQAETVRIPERWIRDGFYIVAERHRANGDIVRVALHHRRLDMRDEPAGWQVQVHRECPRRDRRTPTYLIKHHRCRVWHHETLAEAIEFARRLEPKGA